MTPDMRACPQCDGDAGPTINRPEPGSSVLERYRSRILDDRAARTSTQLTAAQRVGAEQLRMETETQEVLNLLLLHCGISPLRHLEFHSSSDEGLSGLRLRISSSPPVINKNDNSIDAAIKIGEWYLEEFEYAVDTAACRYNNFRPLPRRNA